MKKIYLKLLLIFLFSALIKMNTYAGAFGKKDDDKTSSMNVMRNITPQALPSILASGTDVIINSVAENQQDLKIATAFNGWVFAVYTGHGGPNDGIRILKSTTNGMTWNVIGGNSGNYYGADIAVCGSSTSSLTVFVMSVYHPSPSDYIVWSDRYDGTAGSLTDEPLNEEFTDSIYSVALAHDFLHPSANSSPYSVEAIFSKHSSSSDSVIARLSTDGGNTFGDRKIVDVTTDRFGKVAVSYGYSNVYTTGRYFVAYEQRTAGNKYGHIKESRTNLGIGDPYTAPVFLDSAYSSFPDYWVNHAVNPSISVQNSSATNDSSGLSILVLWESQYNGSTDIDVVGAYTLKLNSTSLISEWNYCYPDYSSGTHSKNPNVCFDESNNYFLVTYWDSTNNNLAYCTQSFNMPYPAATTWPNTVASYNDHIGTLNDPFPQVNIDPSSGSANFAWQEIRSGLRTGLFDANAALTSVHSPDVKGFSLHPNHPNPANDFTIISFDIDKTQNVSLDVFDLLGTKVSSVASKNVTAGSHQFRVDVSSLPSGYYIYTLKTESQQETKELVVTH